MSKSHQRARAPGTLLLAAPAIVLMAGGLAAPVARLAILALHSESGAWTLSNFSTIASSRVEHYAMLNTFELGISVTALCVFLGVPFAFAMSVAKRQLSTILIAAVTIPFWTALLVRTYTWLVILQRHGLVNQLLTFLGVIDAPLPLVNNFTGTVIGMTHIMLPVFILPVYAAFRSIDPAFVRAALSLGADRWTTVRLVILPLAAAGIASGAGLVFVASLGFYVTPIILGGGHVAVLSVRIERNIALFGDWGAASAIGLVLLVIVLVALPLTYAFIKRLWQRRNWHYA